MSNNFRVDEPFGMSKNWHYKWWFLHRFVMNFCILWWISVFQKIPYFIHQWDNMTSTLISVPVWSMTNKLHVASFLCNQLTIWTHHQTVNMHIWLPLLRKVVRMHEEGNQYLTTKLGIISKMSFHIGIKSFRRASKQQITHDKIIFILCQISFLVFNSLLMILG